MHIHDIMNSPAVTCRSDDNLATAARLMWDQDCGIVPVVNEHGQLAGVITDRDICMATFTRNSAPQHIQIGDAMAKQVFSCRAEDTVEAAEQVMSDHQVRRIPIVDGDNRPVGILSLNDLARHAISSQTRDGMDREVTKTLAAICQPGPKRVHAQPQQQPSAPM